MAKTVLYLDHEYGKNAKLNIEFKDDDRPLKLIDLKIKQEGIKRGIENFIKNNPELEGKINSSNTYMFSCRFNLKPKYDPKIKKNYEDISDEISFQLNTAIQKELKNVLTENELDFKQYYRSDVFFEYVVSGNHMIINWSKKGV